MSEVKVDSIGPRVDSGTLTIGAAGDTVNIAGTAGTGFPTPTTGIAASAITTGTMATARLGSGTIHLTFMQKIVHNQYRLVHGQL